MGLHTVGVEKNFGVHRPLGELSFRFPPGTKTDW